MIAAKIHALPPEVIGQIAAGEVVERPAAAIKELVENSIDAGATAVTVEIREGGISYFRVSDNGCGIRPGDIKLAFARHATSKIQSASDLYGVRSLGFRGEALASIAAVARVKCVTRTQGADNGLSVENEGGEFTDIRDAACPEGTTFTVRDLFFNAPVRKKFLKRPATESAYVSENMAHLILSHPEISFRFTADGKTVYFSAGDGKLESAIMSVYGVDTLKSLLKIEGNMNGIRLSGFVGVGELARGNRNHEHFFLNGRAMKSTLLSAALEEACRQRITISRFPLAVLHLDMPFENVDVNVHPNKWEIRFQDEKAVRQAVETLISEALTGADASPLLPHLFQEEKPAQKAQANITFTDPVPAKENQAAPTPAKPEAPERPSLPLPKPYSALNTHTFRDSAAETPVNTLPAETEKKQAVKPVPTAEPVWQIKNEEPRAVRPQTPPQPAARQPAPAKPQLVFEQLQSEAVAVRFAQKPLKLIGVVFNTYIILEYGDTMLLCDQHAAHERLLYERFMKQTDRASASQTLLIPQLMELSRTEYAAFEENEQALRDAGFDLEAFGTDAVQIRAVPMLLGQPQAVGCLREALDELAGRGTLSVGDRTSRVIQMACKHAVKGGEEIPQAGILQLVRDILENGLPLTCPHGRPIFVQLTHTELDKRFSRIQSDKL